MKIRQYILFIVSILMLISCEYDFPEDRIYTEEDLGEINIDKLIAVGDDYMAGVMNGALFSAGQENSIAAILASGFSVIDNREFIQPTINSENGFNLYVSEGSKIQGKWIYRYENNTDEEAKLVLTLGEAVKDYSGDKNALSNLSIPQLYAKQLSTSDMDGNPFFLRTFFNDGRNIIEQVVQRSPSFVFAWVGINDYLNYAMQGASNPEDFTPIDDFKNNYNLFI
jgi:hypothetical protein